MLNLVCSIIFILVCIVIDDVCTSTNRIYYYNELLYISICNIQYMKGVPLKSPKMFSLKSSY